MVNGYKCCTFIQIEQQKFELGDVTCAFMNSLVYVNFSISLSFLYTLCSFVKDVFVACTITQMEELHIHPST